MSEESRREIEWLREQLERQLEKPSPPRRVHVNKKTHRVRFEDETEDGVTIVIEEKGGQK